MRLQPIELFRHVHALRDEGELLLQASFVECAADLVEAGAHALAIPQHDVGQGLPHPGHLHLEVVEPVPNHDQDAGAFAFAHRDEIGERTVEPVEHGTLDEFGVRRRRLHHARPAQNVDGTDGRGLRQKLGDRARRMRHPRREVVIDR